MLNEETNAGGLELTERDFRFIAHIIRDVFPDIDSAVINYGLDQTLVPILRGPEHSVEAWGLHTDLSQPPSEYVSYWLIAVNDTRFGLDFCRLFVCFDYDPIITPKWPIDAAESVKDFLVEGGFVVVTGDNSWSSVLDECLSCRDDIATELKRYYIFRDSDVKVYQK